MSQHSGGRSFIALDGLRGVAALCVVVLHAHRYMGPLHLPTAYLAVDLFFVLSGFVLAHAYEGAFRAGLSPTRFMVQRLIRLYPLYLLGTALGVIEALLSIRYHGGGGSIVWTWDNFWNALPFALFMLPCPPGVSKSMFPFDGVMWSIFFELLANLLWAFTWKRFNSTRALVIIVAFAAIGLIASAFYWGSLAVGLHWTSFLGGLARVLFGFPLGILLYRLHQQHRFVSLPTGVLLLSLPLLFLTPSKQPLAELVLVLFVMPAIVYATASAKPGPMLGFLCSKLGESSYGVYAIHKRVYLLSYAGLLQLFNIRAEIYSPWIGLLFLVGIVLLCVAIHEFADVPVRRWLSSRFAKRTASPERTAGHPSHPSPATES